eukprot:COSAG01_NODE_3011_length_6725_cov_71.575158_2_plen_196_part_00
MVTGRNKTVAEGRNKRVFWGDDERDVLIREMAASMAAYQGNGCIKWKEMAASIAASGQLDKTADQIRGHVHTQRFKKTWDSTVNQPLHELVPPAQARKKRPRKKSHVSPCLSVFYCVCMASLSDVSFPAMLQNAAAAHVTAPPVTVNQPLQNGTLTEEFNNRFVLRTDFDALQTRFNLFEERVIGWCNTLDLNLS